MAKDDRYFSHDANASHDPKIMAMMNKYGVEGYGRFWLVLEMMRTQESYKIDDKPYNWSALAQHMLSTTDKAKEFVSDCIEVYELFTRDENGFIYSASLQKRMIHLDNVRAQRVRAGQARQEKLREEQWKD